MLKVNQENERLMEEYERLASDVSSKSPQVFIFMDENGKLNFLSLFLFL